MTRVLKILFTGIFVATVAFALGGMILWFATSRGKNFYTVNAFSKEAPVSLWIQFPTVDDKGSSKELQRVSVSLWLNPAHAQRAFAHFDDWLQEYLLILEETDVAAQDEPHVLPPVPVPPEEGEGFDGAQDENDGYFERDPYDLAFADFFTDVWKSGFIALAGSAYFDFPIWAKPFSGWLVAAAQSQFSPYIFDSLIAGLIVRSDGADLPSWLDAIPRAQAEIQSGEPFVREAFVDLGGRELAELFGRLCDLENLSDDYCSDVDPVENPLSPLLALSENFQIQLSVFWTLRGQHLLWSNNRDCLLTLLHSGVSDECGGGLAVSESQRYVDGHQLRRFAKGVSTGNVSSAGVLLNQNVLARKVEQTLGVLSTSSIDGASWLEDFFNSSAGEVFVSRVREVLGKKALGSELWGAEIVYQDSGSGVLVNSLSSSSKPPEEEQIRRLVLKQQFDFLNAVMSAWMGVPHSTSRLAETKPWVKKNEHWHTETVYRLGWSEQE